MGDISASSKGRDIIFSQGKTLDGKLLKVRITYSVAGKH